MADSKSVRQSVRKCIDRLVCLAAASWSYDVSSDRLEEFCGLKIGDTAIREISQRRGAAMNAWQNSDPEACREFRESEGEVEFTTDGTSVNTTEGWRETKQWLDAGRSNHWTI